jgi:hypothetical protein
MAYVSQEDKKELSPAIKAVLKKYKMKGSIAVRHHSTLVVNVRSGVIDFSHALGTGGNLSVNQYWINENHTGVVRDFLNELLAAMEGPKFFNKDDSMTDYFYRSHYTDINIGQWNKPYLHSK